jgi:hypothetical protein
MKRSKEQHQESIPMYGYQRREMKEQLELITFKKSRGYGTTNSNRKG